MRIRQHGDDFCQLALQLAGRDSSIGADPTGTPGSAGWRGMLAAATTASVAAFAIARAANASTCYSAYIAQYAAMPAPPALRATPLLLSAIVAAKAREIADAINREATKATGPWPSPAETNPDAFGQWGGLPQGSSISPWQWLQNAQSSALAQPQDFDEEGMRVLVAEEEEEMRLRCSPPSPEPPNSAPTCTSPT